MAEVANYCCFVELEHGPLVHLYLHQPSVLDCYIYCQNFTVLELVPQTRLVLNSRDQPPSVFPALSVLFQKLETYLG